MSPEDIKKLRLELHLSQQHFATMIGVSITSVNKWENGKSKPSPLAKQKLYKLVGKV